MLEIAQLAFKGLVEAISTLVADRLLAKTQLVGRFRQETEIKKYFANSADKRRASRLFETVADCIARPLEEFVAVEARELNSGETKAAILNVLNSMIDENAITIDLFIKNNFDARRIRQALDKEAPRSDFFGTSAGATSRLAQFRQRLDPVLHSFFDSALDTLIITSSEILIGLEPFRVEKDKIILRSIGKISDDVDEILNKLTFLRNAEQDAATVKSAQYETWYRHELSKSVGYLDLLGIDVPEEIRLIPLEVGYITLSVNISGESGDPRNVSANVLLSNTLAKKRSILIRGEAGSGKTTLTKWLTQQLATGRSTLSEITSGSSHSSTQELKKRRYLPFLLQLRHTGLSLNLNSLGSRCSHIGEPPDGWIENQLKRGAVVILDGIDEISPADRTRLRTFIEHLY
jgi:hypothetical protein